MLQLIFLYLLHSHLTYRYQLIPIMEELLNHKEYMEGIIIVQTCNKLTTATAISVFS